MEVGEPRAEWTTLPAQKQFAYAALVEELGPLIEQAKSPGAVRPKRRDFRRRRVRPPSAALRAPRARPLSSRSGRSASRSQLVEPVTTRRSVREADRRVKTGSRHSSSEFRDWMTAAAGTGRSMIVVSLTRLGKFIELTHATCASTPEPVCRSESLRTYSGRCSPSEERYLGHSLYFDGPRSASSALRMSNRARCRSFLESLFR